MRKIEDSFKLALEKINNFYCSVIDASIKNNYNKDAFMAEFKKRFKNNLNRVSECILKKLNKPYRDIANMNDIEIMNLIMMNVQAIQSCSAIDNQINFIMMCISVTDCNIDYNKLFDYTQQKINNSQNIIEIMDIQERFLLANGCCTGGLTNCDGTCVDTTSNRDYCGSCTNKCGVNQFCASGVCTSPITPPVNCPPGLTNCTGTCVDTTSDYNYCGSCTTKCQTGYSCYNNSCLPTLSIIRATTMEGVPVGTKIKIGLPVTSDGISSTITITSNGTQTQFNGILFAPWTNIATLPDYNISSSQDQVKITVKDEVANIEYNYGNVNVLPTNDKVVINPTNIKITIGVKDLGESVNQNTYGIVLDPKIAYSVNLNFYSSTLNQFGIPNESTRGSFTTGNIYFSNNTVTLYPILLDKNNNPVIPVNTKYIRIGIIKPAPASNSDSIDKVIELQ